MARGQYPTRKNQEYDDVDDERQSLLDEVKQFASRDLAHIGLDKVAKLTKMHGKDDYRVKKAKLECFFNAYAVLGTVKYAAQVCGLNPQAVTRVIKSSPRYQERFDEAHDEFCQYLEQTAVVRAVTKSDSLLQFLLRANNPRKFSERMRIQALTSEDDNSPITLNFGEVSADYVEPNYADPNYLPNLEPITTDKEEDNIG